MSELLNKLFGLNDIGFGSEGAEFGFLFSLGAWAWVLLALLLCLLSWYSYRGLAGTRPTRITLSASRALLLLLICLLAAGPMLQRVTMRTERDSVLVLLDRSGSLETPDADGQSRDTQLASMLASNSESWNTLAESKRVVWYGFSDQTTALSNGKTPATLPAIGGRSSQLSAAIADALDDHSGQPISGIVLVSDGRSTDALDPELLNRLNGARISVHSVPLGSSDPVRDLAITRIESPDLVFADDRAPIRVDLNWSGINPNSPPATLELIDHTTNSVVQSIPINPSDFAKDGTHRYTLLHTLEQAGAARFDVVIRTDPIANMNPDNDSSPLTISALDRPLRVLYIDGYPRWEQRYLKNLLTREDSIAGTAMLLAADRRYVQDGDVLIDRVPTSVEQWKPYDVIVLGDVRPELFTPQQLEGLSEHISDNGAGLLWIGGPSATPSGWLNSPIAALLPMRSHDAPSGVVWDQPITMQSTPEADRLGILQLSDSGWDERVSDPNTGWSQLRQVQRIDTASLKPGVAILADANPIDTSAESSPVVLSMRYGAGNIGYVATDEIWRWRYGRGEALPERFYLPMIRMLARGSVTRGSAPALLRTAPSTPEPSKPVQITLELLDQALIETLPESIPANITREGSNDPIASTTLSGAADARLGTWIPDEPGRYRVSLDATDPLLAAVGAQIFVLNGSDERRTLDTNHPLLEELASETSGQIIEPSEFSTIPSLLPNRARTIALPPERVSLWDRSIILLLLVLLLTSEWIGRKILRLA